MDTNAVVIIINMSGWLIVGWLAKQYFEDIKVIKSKNVDIETKYFQILLEQKLQAQKIEFLEKALENIDENIHELKDMFKTGNTELIKELKEQLKEQNKK